MADPQLNAIWCRAIAQELRRSGVTTAVLCPGSRNSPLLFALAEAFGTAAISHVDERSGAFIALGAIRASGAAALICVTSGSALANCAPALAEAHAAHLPLIVIAADRPGELHGCGAPQTMPQVHAFGRLSAQELPLVEPVADDRALRSLRARISRSAQARGPSIINVPLREPLLPEPSAPTIIPAGLSVAASAGRAHSAAFTRIISNASELSDGVFPGGSGLADHDARRGLIAAGPDSDPAVIRIIVAATGFPVLADACGGGRRSDLPGALRHGDALIAGSCGNLVPELVIQVGDGMLSRAVYEWLDRSPCQWIACEPDGRDRDWLARAAFAVHGPVAHDFALWQRCGRAAEAWTQAWVAADDRAQRCLNLRMADEPWGEVLAAHLVCRDPRPRHVMLANSMAVRHGNLHAGWSGRGHGPIITANRGVAGIDGQLGSVIGLAYGAVTSAGGDAHDAGQRGATWLLTGDVAMLHDLPALTGLRQAPGGGAVIILNNDGGAIFDYLAVAKHPHYQPWIRTPHGLTFAQIAAGFGLSYHSCTSRTEMSTALDASLSGGWHVIECHVAAAPGVTVTRHRSLLTALATA